MGEKELSKFEVGLFSLAFGVIIGGGFAMLDKPQLTKSQIFQRGQEKPAVMRMYKPGMDRILVENPERKGEYIPVKNYLRRIRNKSDRKIEEAEIEKTVRWYEK